MVIRLGKFQLKLTSLRLWAGLFLGLYFAHVLMPIYWRRPGAGACTFGPVTNEQYREYRKAAEKELFYAQFWMSGDRFKRAKRIAEAADSVSDKNQSLFHRLAAMHAVMRSINGQHMQTIFSGKILKGAENKKDIDLGLKLRSGTFGYRPIIYFYSYSTWYDRLAPTSLLRYLDTPHRISWRPLFLAEKLKNNISVENQDDGYINNSFNIAVRASYPNPTNIPPRNRWQNKFPYGPCPKLPSEQTIREFISKNNIINVRP